MDRICKCAAGFVTDPTNHTACVNAPSFILYSLNWEIKGATVEETTTQLNRAEILGPISRVQMATRIDFLAAQDYIYWVNSDHGIV